MSVYRIPWKPKVKGRPRVTKQGVAYTPKETRLAEEAVAEAFRTVTSCDERPIPDGPIEVTIRFADDHFDIEVLPCDDYSNRKLRGDVDNYGKLILDSLNGLAWEDDKQIVALLLEKK